MFTRFCFFSIPVAILAGITLLYFGSKLSPDENISEQINYASRSLEIVTYSKEVVNHCIEIQGDNQPEKCQDIREVLKIMQEALDSAAIESMAGSAFHMTQLGYWQYLATSFAAIFIILAVGASYTLLFEASQASKHTRKILGVIKDSRETELQPYLNIIEVFVQTGEPPFGGGNGWIDITFKNYGKTPARYFRNHIIEIDSAPQFSQYVEMLDGAPVVHSVESPGKTLSSSQSPDTTLLDLINAGEECTVRCPVVTDIRDRRIKQRYMEIEWERLSEGSALPRFEGYKIRGSIDFSNSYLETTTRRVRYELTESIDDGRVFRIIEDRRIE